VECGNSRTSLPPHQDHGSDSHAPSSRLIMSRGNNLTMPLCKQNWGMSLPWEGIGAGQALGPHQEPGWCRVRWQGRRQARSAEAGVQHRNSLHRVDTDPGRPQRFPQQCVGAGIDELPHEINTRRQLHGRCALLTCTQPFRGYPWSRIDANLDS